MRSLDVTTWLQWIAPRHFSHLQQAAIGLMFALGAVLASMALVPLIADFAPFSLLIPVIFIVTIVFGGTAALSCLLAGSELTLAFVFREDSLTLTGRGATITTLAFLGIAASLIIIGVAMRKLILSARAAHARADILASESGHRAKNMLTLAQVIVHQSAKSCASVGELVSTVEDRFGALGRAQSVAELHAGTPPLREVAWGAVSPFDANRLEIGGPSVRLQRDAAKNLGLLFHELCTNAMKYGALSISSGRVRVHWTKSESAVEIEWQELGGPAVKTPTSTGFGSRLAKTLFLSDGGGVKFDYSPAGLICRVKILNDRTLAQDQTSRSE